MRATAWLLLFASSGCACARAEKSENSPNTPTVNATATATAEVTPPTPVVPPRAIPAGSPTSPPRAQTEPRCVVALPDPPLPAQKPAEHCPKDVSKPHQLERRGLRFPEASPGAQLTVERAVTPADHERGLMFRTNLPENHGMLFEWPSETQRVFWMRNTCIPLDMLFIAKDGTVAGIQEQVPTLNEAPRSVPCPAAYVLEVNAGWCRRHGVKPGMQMKLD